MDDVGASSKVFEVYSQKKVYIKGSKIFDGDWLFFKFIPPFRAWGPYRELSASNWLDIFDVLKKFDAVLTVAITAAWVDRAGELTAFPQRFPRAAEAIKEGLRQGILEIANHGLTHCVLDEKSFLPRLMESNRRFHREFVDWIPSELHRQNLVTAQQILEDYFQVDVETFVPPGNQFTENTLDYAAEVGLKYVSCNTPPDTHHGITLLGNQNTLAFHDREIVLHGMNWLRRLLENNAGADFVFVRDLATRKIL